MKLKYKFRTTILTLLGVIICIATAQAQMEITVSGGWAPSIGTDNLTAGAGSDLSTTLESAADQVGLSISNTSEDPWKVNIKVINDNWHNNLNLSIKRNGDGIGGGSILGGFSYIPLDTTDTQFFTGTGNLSNIPIQMKLQGVSLQVPPSTYSATITYTVVEI